MNPDGDTISTSHTLNKIEARNKYKAIGIFVEKVFKEKNNVKISNPLILSME
jgi:hypothetical protein